MLRIEHDQTELFDRPRAVLRQQIGGDVFGIGELDARRRASQQRAASKLHGGKDLCRLGWSHPIQAAQIVDCETMRLDYLGQLRHRIVESKIVQANAVYDPALRDANALLDAYHTLTEWSAAMAAAGAQVSVVQRFHTPAQVDRDGITYEFVKDSQVPWLSTTAAPAEFVGAVSNCAADIVHVNGLIFPQLIARIRQAVDKVNALTREEFVRNDFGLAMQMGVQLIAIMTAISAALAALIVGFTAYSLVARRRRELAVVKALGVGNPALIGGVVFQALTVTLGGYVLAAAAAVTLIPWVPVLAPQVTVAISTSSLATVGLAALPVALAGAVLPAHMVARVDPASAFQG